MKKIVLFTLVLAVVSVSMFAIGQTGEKDQIAMLEKSYNRTLELMKSVDWINASADKEAGWIARYEKNYKDVYVSIKKGFTEEGKAKMAFNAWFENKHIYCFCYLENSWLMVYVEEDKFGYAVYRWLAEKGFFDKIL